MQSATHLLEIEECERALGFAELALGRAPTDRRARVESLRAVIENACKIQEGAAPEQEPPGELGKGD